MHILNPTTFFMVFYCTEKLPSSFQYLIHYGTGIMYVREYFGFLIDKIVVTKPCIAI